MLNIPRDRLFCKIIQIRLAGNIFVRVIPIGYLSPGIISSLTRLCPKHYTLRFYKKEILISWPNLQQVGIIPLTPTQHDAWRS